MSGSFALKIPVDRGQSVLCLDFDRRLIQEFHGPRTELEDITMDIKKFITDLAAGYRKLTEQTPSSSLAPPRAVADVDAAHEAGRKAGYEVGHAEGYEAGYKMGYDEGFQIGLEAKTPPESPPPEL